MKKAVVVTTSWDDGHCLDVRLAELLKKYQLRGTFYIAPQDWEIEPRQRLNLQQLLNLSRDFEIGGHTLTHQNNLTLLNDRELRQEIVQGKKNLEQIIAKKVEIFSYTRGIYDKRVVGALRNLGFVGARTIRPFVTDFPKNDFEIGVTIQVNPIFNVFRNAKIALRNNPKLVLAVIGRNWVEIAKQTFSVVLKSGGVWHLWGHSWEIEQYQLWGQLEEIFGYISQRSAVKYLNNGELIKKDEKY